MLDLVPAARAFALPYYAEPHRAYHTAAHVEAMLEALRVRRALTPTLELAAWGHDLIYDPRATDNEARSADVFGAWLTANGAPAPLAEEVRALILATTHDAPPCSLAAALFVDADLSVFGADEQAFWAYERHIRQEYVQVPWLVYRTARMRVLRQFLDREPLYRTPAFADLEVPARVHLRAALGALRRRWRA
ncbi:HD domain-containing protein [Deinococcus maricopensis]|uniref:Phosphohydrolase n=1 Tax=Deinococcus maricopensis (strain DSM 21211 / LMG 22137 / NRRL B-23946 / LB-34) TaxID=709986 RepID=E8UBE4_DEIML|nr:phosphohydrolase [Deinococcus maricopensis]ADV68383.1 hypothetical protein Deima_2754 [Deinococcus maricopensis DSM 21211]